MAEADGNRTRQGPNRPLTGFEDRGTHQASVRLRGQEPRGFARNRTIPDTIPCSMPERSFGRTVRYRRTKLGLSQAKLGELVGRSVATIRSWERDERYPTETKVITALSAILGVDERTLYDKAGLTPPEVETSPTLEQALATLAPERDASGEEVPAQRSVPTHTTGQVEMELRPLSEPSYEAPLEQFVITPAAPPIAEPSYLEDKAERQRYRVRSLATLAVVVALVIALLWALAQGLESFGEWWDEFFGTLRL